MSMVNRQNNLKNEFLALKLQISRKRGISRDF